LEDEAYGYDRERLARRQDQQEANKRDYSALEDFFFRDRLGNTSLADILLYLAGIGGLLFFAFSVMKIDVRGIFSKKARSTEVPYDELPEDIEEMDFEQLIRQAKQKKQYRRAVRLLYLETLKTLTRQQLIHWQPNKTNHDYLEELKGAACYQDFFDLTLRFEYVWYGDFPIGEAGFSNTEKTFQHFQLQLLPRQA
jgi:hypothetical protein